MDKLFHETNTDIHVTIFEFLNVFDYSKVASTNKEMFNMIANNIKIRKRMHIYHNIKPNITNSRSVFLSLLKNIVNRRRYIFSPFLIILFENK